MKRATLLVMGQDRLVYEDQVRNALGALSGTHLAAAKNDRILLRAIVEDWMARRMYDAAKIPEGMWKAGGGG